MKARVLLSLLIVAAALPVRGMTPEEAYAAIPHHRTTFDAKSAKMPPAQADSLERLFALSDQGVILRVEGMRAQRQRNVEDVKRILGRYDALIEKLQAEKLDAAIVPARDLVVQALRDHRRYLASQPEGGMQFAPRELAMSPLVKQASGRLIGAYSLLMRTFPGEPARNKTSFYDYLCALDYL